MEQIYNIVAINTGSTTTKIAVFKNEHQVIVDTIWHSTEELKSCVTVADQEGLRTELILQFLAQHGFDMQKMTAIVARGGQIKPIPSGTYAVNDAMLRDLRSEDGMAHASGLSGLIARDIGDQFGLPAYIVDPVVVDELCDVARISGIPQIQRKSVFHALNTKAIARKACKTLGKAYGESNLVLAHIGGGISVGAHEKGRAIDVSDALNGTGPFSPTRSGSLPLIPLIDMCFSGEYSQKELKDLVQKNGGVEAYLGTSNMIDVGNRVKEGDPEATLIWEAMAHQLSKEIGGMCAVLAGDVDAIILTGGVAHSKEFTALIEKRVGKFAPFLVYPGEDEMTALAEGALRVLRGQEAVSDYIG